MPLNIDGDPYEPAAPVYCSLCDELATWIVSWNDETQAGCETHRDEAFALIRDRIASDAEGTVERYVFGRYCVTLLPGADLGNREGIWPAYWMRGEPDPEPASGW